ncbi:MAG TPA: hypothetical protein DDW52_27460, partial [Planctomycetaceae bacterium]|nr:hypothetical protein [Planctomycetaceae bacterium]
MEDDMAEVKTIDCAGMSAPSIAEGLASVQPEQTVRLVGGTDGLAGVGSGAWNAERLEVDFSLGDFAFMLTDGTLA